MASEFDADLTACAALVEKADPLRFRATMAAPVAARHVLFPLYAFNVEVARAPWVTGEPMIAEMRLQWWRDALDEIAAGGTVRRHEVVTPLARVLEPEDARVLDLLIEARRKDIEAAPFAQNEDLAIYLDRTASGLLWVAARRLGAGPETEGRVRSAGFAQGLAGWFRAIPALEAAGKHPLPDGRPGTVQTLARDGLERLRRAREDREGIPAPAMLPLTGTGHALSLAAKDPAAVAEGRLAPSAFRERSELAWRALTGRW